MKPLNNNTEFVVGEDKILGYVLSSLFFLLFCYGIIDAIVKRFTNFTYVNYLFFLSLAPSFIYFIKAKNKRVYIRVNKKGIYQDEQFVTNWSNLLNAYFSQKEKAITIQNNFILVLEYRKDGENKGFRRSIPLPNTQKKSEEEVLAAVKFFWKEWRKATILHN